MIRPPAWPWLFLVLALLAGGWMRASGLSWGAGSGFTYHPDEPRFAEQARALAEDAPLRKSYVYGFGQAIRVGQRLLPGAEPILVGRGLSLLAGLALCALIVALARAVGMSPAAAGLAGALVAVNTLCVIHSHYATADMTFTLALYGFSLAVLRGRYRLAAVAAGLAMALKFGLVLLPSLLGLAWLAGRSAPRRGVGAWLAGLAIPAYAGVAFLAAQGFAFDAETLHQIGLSMRADNLGGFVHPKYLNVITYAGVALRALGLPILLAAAWAVIRTDWRAAAAGPARHLFTVAFLPFLLHGVGLLLIHTCFPRHFLPLVPLALLAAARAAERLPGRFPLVAAGLVIWSALLAGFDRIPFQFDVRLRAREVALARGTRIWADPFFKLPLGPAAVDRPSQADLLILTESWTWRFERSELNPLRAPGDAELYHAQPGDLTWYRQLRQVTSLGPPWRTVWMNFLTPMPEQVLYESLWGSFEKFAGTCAIYYRESPPTPAPAAGR